MKSFQWSIHFITGLEDVDLQHRHLVDLINKLASVLTDDTVSFSVINELFRELSNYTEYHFQEEENLMLEANVDSRHRARHLEIHKLFLDEINQISHSLAQDQLKSAHQLLKFLTHWLVYHILGDDQDLAKQIQDIESGTTAAEAYERLKKDRVGVAVPLLDTLNGLFEQVMIRNKELKELNESLEEKVAQRTQQLTEANQHLELLSITDALTGLPNRRHAMQSLADLWLESEVKNQPLSCMMIDVDHFKDVNDVSGHDAGDAVLTQLAKTLQFTFRTDDIVCRLGGDEFLVICPKTAIEGAMHLANNVWEAVSRLDIPTGKVSWQGSISIGVAARSVHTQTYQELIKQADQAVYAAKDAGKNCVVTIDAISALATH